MKLAALAALLFLAPVTVSGQRFDDTLTVNVVEVPVYVERFGVPVAGLTRDDFELFVDGRPQPIESCDVVEEGAAEALRAESSSGPAELKRRRLVVLLFDIGGSSTYALHRARQAAIQFVAESASGDAYAVATIARTGVRFVVPFTEDRVAVQRAIGTLARSRAADPFHVATLDAERTVWGTGSGGAGARGWLPDAELARRDAELEERFLQDWLFADDLADLADQLAPLSGIRHVVLLSEREGVPDPRRLVEPAARVHERYRAAGVVLDAVDIRRPRVPGGMASDAGPSQRAPSLLLSDFLYALALDTGGAVDASLRNLQQRNRVTYVLSFRPPETRAKTSSIRVRVKDRPLFTEVRYRRTYTLDEPESRNDWLFLADTLLNDIPQRGLTVDLDVDLDVQGTTVAVKIPGVELLAYPQDPLLLDVYVYVFDAGGQPAAWHQARVAVELAKGREHLGTHPYTIRHDFRLPPGRYAAKAIVRVAGSGSTGFSRRDFVTP
jgi:VWFA-related protein